MTDVKQWLKKGDPLANEHDTGLSPIDAANMRRAIVSAVVERAPQPVAASWPRPFVMAAVVAACLVVGVSIGLRFDREPKVDQKSSARAGSQGARRQLQFVTTGGTRIIWTFHENFEL
jgi:hypothetical protein